ncbi:MAG: LpqB family beta-propeller domain-containing protein [Brooklawnia sp.]|jgi:hypothetical protein
MNRLMQALALLMVLVLAGCVSFPTSGPVEKVSDARPDGRPGIDVAAQPPVPGASPEAVLEGFFAASEAAGDGYLVARQYLTPEVAGSWRPEAGITVYDSTGQSRVVTVDGSALLRAPLVGRVDTDQVFTAVHEPDFTHNFEMQQVDGEWRIGNPGEGILMSVQRFQRAFIAIPVYYLDPTGQRMVSQQAFLRQTDVNVQSPDALVRAAINGPGTWLRPAVLDALPAEVQSSGTWVDEQGIARLALSEQMEALSAAQRLQAAAQLLFTLGYFNSITGVQISVNGQPLSIPGADQDGVVTMDAVGRFDPQRPVAARDLFGVRDGSVIRLPDAAGAQVQPLPGLLGAGWEYTAGRLATNWGSDQVAVLTSDGRQLYTAATDEGTPGLVHQGTDMVKPQYDANGLLWSIDNTADGPVAVRIGRGRVVTVPLSELGTAEVIAFRISPDATRVAVIADFGDRQELGMLRLRGTEQLVIDGWRVQPVSTSRGLVTEFRDVGFIAADRMMVLGAVERDPQFMVYALDVDGAVVTSQGPLSDVDAVGMTVMPLDNVGAVAVVTATSRGLRYEAQFRWSTLIEDVQDLAYPS